MENHYALIMAGGGGTRLWPMSRSNSPKQMLALIDNRTLFKTSVDRLAPLFAPQNIYIVTGTKYANALRADAPEIPAENFIIEPSARDTAPAAALAISNIHARNPDAIISLLTADHHIGDEQKFRTVLDSAAQLASDNYIVTLGIAPTYPATGFGYIKKGSKIKEVNGFDCFVTEGFREKPNKVTATEFLASGDYSWNSGMFTWTAKRALEEFERQQPKMFAEMREIGDAVDKPTYDSVLDASWPRMPKISIDFAIMEDATRMAVIPVDIGWSDVGSWAALFEVLELDQFGNCFKGKNTSEHVILDTQGSMVYSDRMTATIGVDDIIVIDTEDVLLICHKSRTQDVKQIVNHLRSTEKHDYL